jgi:hypothetical protein
MSEQGQEPLPGYAGLPPEQQVLVRHILAYAEERDMPWEEFAPRLGGVLAFFERLRQELREARGRAASAPVPKGGSAYTGPVPDEAELEAMVEKLPEATRELFLRCTAFQEENRYSAADMLGALADVMDGFAAIHRETHPRQ